jgi:AcrR family transcriptional regulator
MRGEDRRAQILDVVTTIVREQGVQAVTMERVALEAEISKPVVYLHFANTAELLRALLEREERALDAAVAERLAAATTLEETLRACVRPWFEAFTKESSAFRRLTLEQSGIPDLEEDRISRRLRVVEFLAELLRVRGGVRKRDASVAAAILIGGFESAAAYSTMRGRVSASQVERTYELMASAAVGALAPATSGGAPPGPAACDVVRSSS